jgi:hypothetical protein
MSFTHRSKCDHAFWQHPHITSINTIQIFWDRRVLCIHITHCSLFFSCTIQYLFNTWPKELPETCTSFWKVVDSSSELIQLIQMKSFFFFFNHYMDLVSQSWGFQTRIQNLIRSLTIVVPCKCLKCYHDNFYCSCESKEILVYHTYEFLCFVAQWKIIIGEVA